MPVGRDDIHITDAGIGCFDVVTAPDVNLSGAPL